MAGKEPITLGREGIYAVDVLSKNTLIDTLIDRIRAGIGESANDAQCLAVLQRWINPVCAMRDDKPPNLLVRFQHVTNHSAAAAANGTRLRISLPQPIVGATYFAESSCTESKPDDVS